MRHLVVRTLAKGMQSATSKWLLLASLVGAASGLAGLLFYWASAALTDLLLTNPHVVGYPEAVPTGELKIDPAASSAFGLEHLSLTWLLVILVLGGLASGLLIQFGSRAAGGAGTGAALSAYHQDGGHIRKRTVVTKFLATLATTCTGGSAGREGPIALIAAGIGSTIGRWLHLSVRDRRVLLAAGVAGGVAALFRAPLAGAFFAAEVLYRESDVEAEVLIPSFISAVVSYCTFGLLYAVVFPHAPGEVFLASLFATPEMEFTVDDIGQLLGYMLLAMVLVAVCRLHRSVFKAVEWGMGRSKLVAWARPALGALATGLIAIVVLYLVWGLGLVDDSMAPQLAVIGAGYGVVQQALDTTTGAGLGIPPASMLGLLLLIAGGKVLTNACTVGSGGSGGNFGPSVVIGGSIGGAIGLALGMIPGLPASLVPDPAACIVIGMAGYVSVAFKTPVTALLMITDMTGDFSLLLPGMWVCTLAFLFGGKGALIIGQVASPLESPAHRGHLFNDILAKVRVAAVFDPDRPTRTLVPSSSIDHCKQIVTESHQTVYPVVDEDGVLRGIFNLNDLRSFLYDDTLALVAVAEDVATKDLITLALEDSLSVALGRFTERNLEELPVVDADGVFLGLLTRRQVIASYNEVVEELRTQRRAEGYDEPLSDR